MSKAMDLLKNEYWAEEAVKKVHTLYGTESEQIYHIMVKLSKDLSKKDLQSIINYLVSQTLKVGNDGPQNN